jgi:hypothetical protein
LSHAVAIQRITVLTTGVVKRVNRAGGRWAGAVGSGVLAKGNLQGCGHQSIQKRELRRSKRDRHDLSKKCMVDVPAGIRRLLGAGS